MYVTEHILSIFYVPKYDKNVLYTYDKNVLYTYTIVNTRLIHIHQLTYHIKLISLNLFQPYITMDAMEPVITMKETMEQVKRGIACSEATLQTKMRMINLCIKEMFEWQEELLNVSISS